MWSTSNFFNIYEDKALTELSLRFKNMTTVECVFYADPMNADLAAVVLHSRRTPVVFEKNIPISDDAIIEWYHRLMDFGLIMKVGDRYNYIDSELLASQKIDIALKYNASYVITTENELKDYIDTKRVSIVDSEENYYILKIEY